jgi:hypothetical protein
MSGTLSASRNFTVGPVSNFQYSMDIPNFQIINLLDTGKDQVINKMLIFTYYGLPVLQTLFGKTPNSTMMFTEITKITIAFYS